MILIQADVVVQQEGGYICRIVSHKKGYVPIIGEQIFQESDRITLSLPDDYVAHQTEHAACVAFCELLAAGIVMGVYPFRFREANDV